MPGRIVQLSRKPKEGRARGLPKHSVTELTVTTDGVEGDFNRWRTELAGGDPDQAVLLLSDEILDELRAEGWPVEPGELGENLTIAGLPPDALGPGVGIRVGIVELEVSKACDPCTVLYSLPYVGVELGPLFLRTLAGRRGWFARVRRGGTIRRDMTVEILGLDGAAANGRRLIHDADGLNTGVWPSRTDRLVTPTDQFFTRSHAPIPQIDPASWRLEVDGLVRRPRSFTLEQLAALERRSVTATLVCAGLRRDEFLSLGPLPGETSWGPEPISTGVWTGCVLRAVLEAVGVADGARHVEFVGLDRVERHGHRFGFGGSIDLAKALSAEVLLATELNGASLPAAHGFPLRAVVPGWIGARSVKWLGRITLTAEPSQNYFQTRAYRVQRELNPQDPRDVSAGVALGGVPLNAVIVDPLPAQVVPAGLLVVRGWAMGSEGRPPTAVEVSPNAGEDWIPARFAAGATEWSWVMWEAPLELPRGRHTLAVRATDAKGVMQPRTLAETWNVKGYGNNAWHRVAIRAE
ncbi:MAG: molybdopterin-dependent oxidoreductase [Gemmatimonadales bacterium]